MDPATITGLRSLKLSETPVHSDQDLPSIQAPTPVMKRKNRRQLMADIIEERRKLVRPPGTRDSTAARLAKVASLRRPDPEAQTTMSRNFLRELDAQWSLKPGERAEDLGVAGKRREPVSQDAVRNNRFQRRLQELVEGLTSEEESSPDNDSSVTDSDNYTDQLGRLRQSQALTLTTRVTTERPYTPDSQAQPQDSHHTSATSLNAPYTYADFTSIDHNAYYSDASYGYMSTEVQIPGPTPQAPQVAQTAPRGGIASPISESTAHSEHTDSHNGYRHRNGASDTDSPDSSNDTHPKRQHAFGNTGQASCNPFSESARTTIDPGPIQGCEDNSRVRTDTRQFRNDEETGRVIPCPLRLELKCAGMDDNMSSLLRELSNSTHNIFYCNRCKSLLSRITRNNDAELLRRLRKESKECWQVHLRSCRDDHCVVSACAPQPNDGVRHKRTENCKTSREDEKEADANYLYRKLGVTRLGVEIGSKTDHKGKRRSTARKIVRVAEDAAQRNVALESELRNRNRELETLKKDHLESCRQVRELRSANGELCSIIRHALEDMRRGNVDLTNALHERIERHAPSAIRNYESVLYASPLLNLEAQRRRLDVPVHSIANTPLPQLSSGGWPHSAQTQPPLMNADQNMTDLNSFEPQFWFNSINYPQINQ